jgi:hypothetical protein
MSEDHSGPPRSDDWIPIDRAPSRVRREYYRRERRNSIIAMAVLTLAVGLLVWGVFHLVR